MNCDEIRDYFMDYMDGNLSSEELDRINTHLKGCSRCNEELSHLKKMIGEIEADKNAIEVPVDFISSIKNKIDISKFSGAKKRKVSLRTIFIAAAILILSVVTVFAAQEPILEFIKKINPAGRIEALVNRGVGERLNISAVDKDIRITVTDVIADEIQTLVLYKIEDLKNTREYYVDYTSGIEIAERWGKAGEIPDANMCTAIFNYDNKGTLTLNAIDSEEKTIHLAFKELSFKSGDSIEKVKGNWSFELPIKKQRSKTYDINQTVRGDGYTIDFNKITISPTLTVLSFNLRGHNYDEGEKNEGLEDLILIADGKEYKPYNFGHEVWDAYSTLGWGSNEMTFESMYLDKPKNIEIKIKRIQVYVEESKEFIIDLTKSVPQEFEYMGTKIVIDNIKVDKDISFDRYEALDSRQYSVLREHTTIMEGSNSEKYFSAFANYKEAFYVDKYGNKYEYYDALSRWEEIRDKDPVLYITKTYEQLHPSDKLNIKELKSLKMTIEGYSKTKFVDETIKVKLK